LGRAIQRIAGRAIAVPCYAAPKLEAEAETRLASSLAVVLTLAAALGCATATLLPVTALADEGDVEVLNTYIPAGRHRLDLSYTNYDTFAGEANILLPSYTWAPRNYLRFGLIASYLSYDFLADPQNDPNSTVSNEGAGDIVIGVQYDPSAKLTASPWVPDSVGLNATLLIPTGDEAAGLSTDTWLASLSAGWAIDSVSQLWLVPAVGYDFTFAEGSTAIPVNRPFASLDFVWVFKFGGWIGVAPQLGYEFEDDEWVDEFTITVGKMFRSGFGLSLDYGRIEQLTRNIDRDDRQWLLNIYFQFGDPPG